MPTDIKKNHAKIDYLSAKVLAVSVMFGLVKSNHVSILQIHD